MERVAIYLDGGNFFHLVLKKLGVRQIRFDYGAFADFLTSNRDLVRKTYYTGTVREDVSNPHSKKSMSEQTQLFTALWKQKWTFGRSKLRKRHETVRVDRRVDQYLELSRSGISEISYWRDREKGIDVLLATDMLMDAVDDKYDTAILISSDGDFIPAVKCIRKRFKKKVEYVGFSIIDSKYPDDPKASTRPLSSLIANSDIQRTLVESDLTSFILPELPL